MAIQRTRGRSTSWVRNRLPTPVLADPIAKAHAIKALLPDAIEQAEAAGLSLIAAHLGKALQLAERVAASHKDC